MADDTWKTVDELAEDVTPLDTDRLVVQKVGEELIGLKFQTRGSLRAGLAAGALMGTLAARPVAGISGRIYFVTDAGEQRWTRDNGSAWVDAPGRSLVIDPREFGSLGTANDSTVIQAALTYAGTLAAVGGLDAADGSGVTVLMPPGGAFVAVNLTVPSFVTFDLNGSRLDAVFGSSGFVVGNASVNSQHYEIRNGWIECRGVDVIGVKLDHTGGSFGANSASPHPRLFNLRITNGGSNSDCVQCTWARGLLAEWLEVRLGRDGIALLAGTTDAVVSNFITEANRRDGVHGESASHNIISDGKIGEPGRYGLYGHTGCFSWSVNGLLIDNAGYPTPFTGSTPVLWEASDSTLTGIVVSRGDGNAIVLESAAKRNVVRGAVAPYASGGTLTYGLLVTSGATDNDISLTVNVGGSPAMTGLVDPASDLLNNRVRANGKLMSVVGGVAVGPGTYTPIITNGANVASSSGATARWTREGNLVTVDGSFVADTTTGSTVSQLFLSLPIASNLAALTDLVGFTVHFPTTGCITARIIGDSTNDRAQVDFLCDASAGNHTHVFHFEYRIL